MFCDTGIPRTFYGVKICSVAGVRAINKAFSANTNCNLTGFSFGHLGSLLKMADAISCTKVGLKFWPGKRPVSSLRLSYIRPDRKYRDSGHLCCLMHLQYWGCTDLSNLKEVPAALRIRIISTARYKMSIVPHL